MGPYRSSGFYGIRSRMLRAEQKTIESFNAAFPVNNDTTVLTAALLNGVAIGSDFTQRIGRKIQMKSILFRGNVEVDPATTDVAHGSFVRFMIVYDKQWNSQTVGVTLMSDVLQNITTGTGVATVSPMNLNNRDRFKVIMDKRVTVDMGKQTVKVDFFKKFKKPLEVTFSGTTNTEGSIATGALWFLWFGSHPAGNDDASAAYYNRVRFVDI